jgi:hypothetical protein
VNTLRPTLSIQTATAENDPTTQVQWEIYADEAMTLRVDSGMTPRGAAVAGQVGPSSWQVTQNLIDNSKYWWRARAFDGSTLYSPWVNARLFVNLFNDAPGLFNLTSPAAGIEVGTLLPALSWLNSIDPDGDAVTYKVQVFKDVALTDLVAASADLPADAGNTTSWTLTAPLSNHGTYYWLVTAKDGSGAQTPSSSRSFIVNTGNTPPSDPAIVSPLPNGRSNTLTTPLVINNSVDAENDLITYVFEIDTVNTFNSGDKRTSGQIIQNGGATTLWAAANLIENKHYYWRVKAQDGRAESAWVSGDFIASVVNDAPPVPTIKNPGTGAWLSMLQPLFEANPVIDPENEAVTYQFEVYRDAALTNKVTDGSSLTPEWTATAPLADKTTHWWRVRATDASNASSAWSLASVLYISSGPYQNPTIEVTAPATVAVPDVVTVNGTDTKQVTIRWNGNDPNIDANVALYYSNANAGYAGSLIIDGLHQSAGSQAGTYVWDVTALPSGTYYVYAIIYDAKGVGRAYAPGAVVIPPAQQTGQVVVNAATLLSTSEAGAQATFTVSLGSAPTANVVVPVSAQQPKEGLITPASLTFTTSNWATPQTVTVKGQDDCTPDGTQQYGVSVGKAVSVDANYIGLSGATVQVANADNSDRTATTNNAQLHICHMTIASYTQVAGQYEYVLTGDLTNNGLNLSSVIAKISSSAVSIPITIVPNKDTLHFGAVATGETVRSVDTVTVRTTAGVGPFTALLNGPLRWTVTPQP